VRTAVDSSVLLDVLTDDPDFADRSEASLRKAAREGVLVVCECVLAEVRPALPDGDGEEFLADWQIEFIPSTRSSALLAGSMFGKYLRRRPQVRGRVIPDFLIGAHAVLLADRLLARDRGYLRDYFGKLKLMTP
jgi:predicted nucleic acid-binding protein